MWGRNAGLKWKLPGSGALLLHLPHSLLPHAWGGSAQKPTLFANSFIITLPLGGTQKGLQHLTGEYTGLKRHQGICMRSE